MITKTGLIYSDNEDLSVGTYSGTIEKIGQVNSIKLPDFPVGIRIYCKAYYIDEGVTIESEVDSYEIELPDYLYILNTHSGQNTITLSSQNISSTYTATSVEYSKDLNVWTSLTLQSGGTNTITIEEGEKVYFRNNTGKFNGYGRGTTFTCNESHIVGGDLRSLLNYTNISGTMIPESSFFELFMNDQTLTSAENLNGFSKNSKYCYRSMFSGCTALVSAPVITATVMTYHSCEYMFKGCTALTVAPELPATTLGESCYHSMFEGCTALITPPETLPATTLPNSCYQAMFLDCTSLEKNPSFTINTVGANSCDSMFGNCSSMVLETVPELKDVTTQTHCYERMFYNCSSIKEVPELPATTASVSCYQQMFQGCSSIQKTPELPATSISASCYQQMFQGCSSLVYPPTLPATTLGDTCYNGMFSGCTALTSAPTLPATTLAPNCYGNMFANCTSLVSAPTLPATTMKDYCYSSMFAGCTSLTSAPALPATTLAPSCYNYMFQGCTSLVYPPTLPAKTLVTNCYFGMFWRCTSLNTITTYADDISASNCTDVWLSNVATKGTFINLGTATYQSGANGIPNGWREVI